MIDKIKSVLDIFDVGDLRFFLIVAKKNFKNLISLTLLISLIVFLFSLNQEKKYLSSATIVVAPDEQNLVNIEEVYSLESLNNRINNQMAILKSDEVYEYILSDKKNITQFKNLYSQNNQNVFQRIFTKKQTINKAFLKNILSRNFSVRNIPRSDVLELSFVSNNPKISPGFILKDILSRIFLSSNDIEIFFISKRGSVFLNDLILNFLIIAI